MMQRWMMRSVFVLMFVTLGFLVTSCGDDDDPSTNSETAPSNDDDAADDTAASDTHVLTNGLVTATVFLQPFGVRLSSEEKGVFFETLDFGEGNSLYYNRNGTTYHLGALEKMVPFSNGVTLHYQTTENERAKVVVSFTTEHTVKVALTVLPSDGWLYCTQDLRLFDEEAIYGLTERINWSYFSSEMYPKEIGSLNRRGEWMPMVIQPSFGIYAPFHQSSNGYGLYVDTTFYGDYDIGKHEDDRLRFTFWTTKDRDPNLAYYIFYGPSHDTILDEYTQITGRPFIPPEWAFKHWRWRDEHDRVYDDLDGYTINGQVAEDVKKYEEYGLPVGNYLIDRPWTPGAEGFAEFAWDETRFPNPQHMLDSLFTRGYHFGLWGAPWAIGDERGQLGWEAKKYGYLAPGSRNHIDFTNPAAFEWLKKHIYDFTVVYNVQEWKLDRGDEEQPSTWRDIYWDGRTGAEMRNAYPVIYQQCYHDAMREAWGDDFLNVYRSGFAGSQHFGVANGGDLRGAIDGRSTDLGLRSAIIMQQRVAFMGFPVWGSNTGGYEEFVDREVFARWLEFSAFSPIMDIGGCGNHAPWNMPQEPTVDDEVIDIYRTYTTLHHDLVEYIYANALLSGETGRPIVRSLVFDYPDDRNVRDMWDEYFLGTDILVAPVWRTGARERQVYLPEGDFVSYWDPETTITGPILLTVDVPLDEIPFYIKKGANVLGRTW